MSDLPFALGSARSGLIGPYAFAPNWSFQRQKALNKSARHRAHHLWAQAGERVHGVPLYIEAVTPPLKRLRHLVDELARVVWIHQCLDIGFEALRGLFPGAAGEACIDFAASSAITAYPREGTRWFLGGKRRWFGWWYAELQRRALASGRYFPPPTVLRARTTASGLVRMELGYAHGFLPDDRRYVLTLPLDGKGGHTWLLAPDEPLPARPGMREWLQSCAQRWQGAGEAILHIGDLWCYGCPTTLDGLREADELTVRNRRRSAGLRAVFLARSCRGARPLHPWRHAAVARAGRALAHPSHTQALRL